MGYVASFLNLGCEQFFIDVGFTLTSQARIRVQVSAAHERQHLDRAVEAFTAVARELGVNS